MYGDHIGLAKPNVILPLEIIHEGGEEVVRCKDCKWYDGTGYITVRCRKKARGLIYCTDDDYCSYGERKEQ